jgi:hypothetical protein
MTIGTPRAYRVLYIYDFSSPVNICTRIAYDTREWTRIEEVVKRTRSREDSEIFDMNTETVCTVETINNAFHWFQRYIGCDTIAVDFQCLYVKCASLVGSTKWIGVVLLTIFQYDI